MDGMPIPHAGEGFVSYWTRIGFDRGVVRDALHGLSDTTADLANLRMARLVGERAPGAMARASSKLIRRDPAALAARAQHPDGL